MLIKMNEGRLKYMKCSSKTIHFIICKMYPHYRNFFNLLIMTAPRLKYLFLHEHELIFFCQGATSTTNAYHKRKNKLLRKINLYKDVNPLG